MAGMKKVAPKGAKPATKTPRRPQLDKMANGAGGYNKTISTPQATVKGNSRPQLDKMSPGTGRTRLRGYDANIIGLPPQYNFDKLRPSFASGEDRDRQNVSYLQMKKNIQANQLRYTVTEKGKRRSGVGK